MTVLPRTIVADPGWLPALHANTRGRVEGPYRAGPQRYYTTQSIGELLRMPPPATQPKAHLWLWFLNQHVEWGLLLMKHWGFKQENMFTWHKPGLGLGRLQGNTESCLLGRKGGPVGNAFGFSRGTGFDWPHPRPRMHSRKPDEFYKLVERVSPGPYHEMFARFVRPGWTQEGDQLGMVA